MTATIIADAVINISLANNVVRVVFGQNAGDNQVAPSGTLLIPANIAGPIISGLANGVSEISEKVKQQQEVQAAEELVKAVEDGSLNS
jgi:hypothetical protein